MKLKKIVSVITAATIIATGSGPVESNAANYTLSDRQYLASNNYGGYATNNGTSLGNAYEDWIFGTDEIMQKGYLNKTKQPNTTYTVIAPADGDYYFQVKYGTQEARLAMSVNDKTYITSYETVEDDGTCALFCVSLKEGQNVIRCLVVPGGDNKQHWCDLFYMKADSRVVVNEEKTTLYPGKSSYIINWEQLSWNENAVGNTGSYIGRAKEAGVTYDNYGLSNMELVPYFSFTVVAPRDGYYDIGQGFQMADGDKIPCYTILQVDGAKYKCGFDRVASGEVNTSTYLKKGTHTLTFTAAICPGGTIDGGYPGWFDVDHVNLYGGLTLASEQIDPRTIADVQVTGKYLASNNYGGFNTGQEGEEQLDGMWGGNIQSVEKIQKDGYLNRGTHPNSSYSVTAPSAGDYYFEIRYDTNGTKLAVSVNDDTYITDYQIINDNGNCAMFCVPLQKGLNVLRFLPGADGDQSKWCDFFYMKADSRVTVNEEKTTLYPANSSYIVNWETSGNQMVNTGAHIGGGAGVDYYNYGTDKFDVMPSFSFTVDAPSDGYYDISQDFYTGSEDGANCYMILRADGVNYMRGFDRRYSSRINTSVYLSQGTHTITFTSAICIDASVDNGGYLGWYNVGDINLYGGLTLATEQVDPHTIGDATRLAAGKDGITWRYPNRSTSKDGTPYRVAGMLLSDCYDQIQSFVEMSDTKWIEKSNLPSVSYTVNAPEAGEYTVRSVYTLMPNAETASSDYFMAVSVNDEEFTKAYFQPAVPKQENDSVSEVKVQLKKGYNVIRMISAVQEVKNIIGWLDQDYIEIYGGPATVTGVAPQVTHLASTESEYIYRFSSRSDNTGVTLEWAKTSLGGFQSAGFAVTSESLQSNLKLLRSIGYFSYTVNVPADGFYDLQTYTSHGQVLEDYLALIDKKADGTYSVYKKTVTQTREQWLDYNAQNLSVYLTTGEHTLIITGLLGDNRINWCDMGALTVSGGITKAAIQKDPIADLTCGYEAAEKGLVEGSAYTIENSNTVAGISLGTTIGMLKSNFCGSEKITVQTPDGQTVTDDTAVVTPDMKLSYGDGTTYTITDQFFGDLKSDGTIDIRDLVVALKCEKGMVTGKDAVGDINTADGKGVINSADVEEYRAVLLGNSKVLQYQKKSIGADELLSKCNPIGRLVKTQESMFMESSASNFTIVGDFQGDIYLTLYADLVEGDQMGLFIETDGNTDETMSYIKLDRPYQTVTVKVAENLPAGKHTIKISKSTDAKNEDLYITSVQFTGTLEQAEAAPHKIVYLGDSITSGVGTYPDGSEGLNTYGITHSYFGYANKTADKLNADYYSVSNGGWGLGYTNSPGISIRRIYDKVSMHEFTHLGTYNFDEWQPDVVVINLGTNDGYRSETEIKKEVAAMLDDVRDKHPNAEIFWAYGAMGATATKPRIGTDPAWIQATVETFARSDGHTHYVSLPADQDGWGNHPTVAGQQAIADKLASEIAKVMNWEVVH